MALILLKPSKVGKGTLQLAPSRNSYNMANILYLIKLTSERDMIYVSWTGLPAVVWKQTTSTP